MIYIISQNELPVAVIRHDHATGQVNCFSKKESFRKAFDVACSNVFPVLCKVEGGVRFLTISSDHHGWFNNVLQKICTGDWYISEELDSCGEEIEVIVEKYLS